MFSWTYLRVQKLTALASLFLMAWKKISLEGSWNVTQITIIGFYVFSWGFFRCLFLLHKCNIVDIQWSPLQRIIDTWIKSLKTFPNAVNLNEGQDNYMRKTNVQTLKSFKILLLFARASPDELIPLSLLCWVVKHPLMQEQTRNCLPNEALPEQY